MKGKWIAGIVVGFIVIVVALGYVVLSSYNFNDLKPRIAGAVKEATGRDLNLAGDITLALGLNPALVVKDVSFQNAPWGSQPEMATIKRLDLQVELIPLLSKKIFIKRLVLQEPTVLIETDKSGKPNFLFDTARPGASPQAKGEPQPKAPASIPALGVDQLEILKGRFTFRDGKTGATHALLVEKYTMKAASERSPVQLSLLASYDNKPFEVAGTVGPLVALTDPETPWPLKLTAKISGLNLSLDGDIKDVLGARIVSLAADANGASLKDAAAAAGLAKVPDIGPFRVSFQLKGQGEALSLKELKGEVGKEDLVRLTFSGAVRNVLAGSGADIQFLVEGKDLAKVAQIFGKPMPPGAFRAAGKITDVADKVYKISDLDVAVADSDLKGSVELNAAGKKPGIKAVLSSDKLDLRPFLPAEGQKSGEGAKTATAGAKRQRVFPSEPLQVGALDSVNANVQFAAKEFYTPKIGMNDLTLGLALNDGNLTLSPLKAGMEGGTLDGQVRLLPKGKVLDLDAVVRIVRLDLVRLNKDFHVSDKVAGKVDLDVNVRGSGSSVAEIMANLNGKTILAMNQGRLDSKYLNLLGANLRTSALRLLNPMSRDKDEIPIECMVVGFDIRNGMADSTALVFDTDQMTVLGDGKVNLKTEGLDIAFNPTPKEGLDTGVLGKAGLSLGELAKPFKLTGTLADPSLGVDTTQAAIAIGKAVGGAALLGPAGIAASAFSTGSGTQVSCPAAVEAARKGVKYAGEAKTQEKKGVVGNVVESTKEAAGSLGGKIKGLFGR
jgi:uncharacterized protein involved in outer membrane biogenesis